MKLDDKVELTVIYGVGSGVEDINGSISYKAFIELERGLQEETTNWLRFVDEKGEVCLLKRDSVVCTICHKRKPLKVPESVKKPAKRWYQRLI